MRGMDKNRRTRWLRLTVLAAVSLPCLYVLSIGPAAYLIHHDYIAPMSTIGVMLEWFFMPLDFVAEHFPPFKAFLNWYIPFWSA